MDFLALINSLNAPQAALFGFCDFLVAYAVMSVVLSAIGCIKKPITLKIPPWKKKDTYDLERAAARHRI